MNCLSRTRRIVILFLTAFVSLAELFAQSDQLTQLNGPELGTAIEMDRDTAGRMFMITGGNDLYATSDLGVTWAPITSASAFSPVRLAIDSTNAILLLHPAGVSRSTDDGISWTTFSTGLAGTTRRKIYVTASGAWLAATSSGIFRKTDSSEVWSAVATNISSPSAYSIARGSGDTLFAGLSSGRIAASNDDGLTWNVVGTISGMPYARHLAMTSGNVLLASPFTGYMFRSTDNGATWTTPSTFLGEAVLAVNGQGTVYGAAYDKVYRFDPSTGDAIVLPMNGLTIRTSTAFAAFGDGLLLCSAYGVYASSDGGTDWQERNAGLPTATINDITIDDLDNLHVATSSGILRSTNDGLTWTRMTSGLTTDITTSIYFASGGYLVTGTPEGIFRSTDHGVTWQGPSVGPTSYFSLIRIVENNAGWLYGTATGEGIVRSTDNGFTWTMQSNGLGTSGLYQVSLGDDSLVYVVGYHQGSLFRSSNGGEVFEPVITGRTDLSSVLVLDPSNVIVGTKTGEVLRSTDEAVSFQSVAQLQRPVEIPWLEHAGDGIIVISSTAGIAMSRDSGATWEAFDSTHAGRFHTAPTFGLSRQGYLGINGRGVFRFVVPGSGLSFGAVPIGNVTYDSLAIHNNADSTVQFDAVLAFGAPFSIEGLSSFELAPDESVFVVVRFEPTTYGSFEDSLIVTSPGSREALALSGSSPEPQLSLSESTIAAGALANDSLSIYSITLSNSSVNAVVIDSLYGLDGPFAATVSAAMIAAWSVETLFVHIQPSEYGSHADTLWIVSNGADPDVSVIVSFTSPPPVLMTAVQEQHFGDIALIDSSEKSIVFQNQSPVNPLTITSLTNLSPHFTFDAVPPLVIPGGATYELTVQFIIQATAPEGYGTYEDTLTVVSDGGSASIRLWGTSEAPGLNFGGLSYYAFFETAIGDTSLFTVYMSGGTNNPSVIDSVRHTHPHFSSVFLTGDTLPPHGSRPVRLRFMPTTFGSFIDTMQVWGNSGRSYAYLPMAGASPFPRLITSPSFLEFGTVQTTTTRPRTITLSDSSINQLEVDSLYTGTTFFHVDHHLPNDIIGQSDDPVSVTVRFTPDSVRQYTDTLYIVSNAEEHVARIPLQGIGSLTVNVDEQEIPAAYDLQQNYPNPFNPSTRLRVGLPVRSRVQMTIVNVLGQEVDRFVDEIAGPGYLVRTWTPAGPSGVYFCRVVSEEVGNPKNRFSDVVKMVFTK